MTSAAYRVKLSVGGMPVFTTDAATTGSGTRTRTITNLLRRIFDPNQTPAPVVRNGSTVLNPSLYSIDYLTGVISFEPAISSSARITVDYAYIPTLEIGGAESYNLNLGADLQDNTPFNEARINGGHRTRVATLLDASLTVSKFVSFEQNPELAQSFVDRLLSREPVLIEIKPADGDVITGWFLLESDNSSGSVSDLETQELSFQLDNLSQQTFTWRKT